MVLEIVILVLLLFGSLVQSGKCQCERVPVEVTTAWGHEYNATKDKKVVKKLVGNVVSFYGEPIDGVLVEVLDNSDIALDPSLSAKERGKRQRRVAACRTNADGRFCFPDLLSGKYELRCSKKELNTTALIVVLDARSRHGEMRELEVVMRAAD